MYKKTFNIKKYLLILFFLVDAVIVFFFIIIFFYFYVVLLTFVHLLYRHVQQPTKISFPPFVIVVANQPVDSHVYRLAKKSPLQWIELEPGPPASVCKTKKKTHAHKEKMLEINRWTENTWDIKTQHQTVVAPKAAGT